MGTVAIDAIVIINVEEEYSTSCDSEGMTSDVAIDEKPTVDEFRSI